MSNLVPHYGSEPSDAGGPILAWMRPNSIPIWDERRDEKPNHQSNGGWRLEVGGWRLEVGGWRLEVGLPRRSSKGEGGACRAVARRAKAELGVNATDVVHSGVSRNNGGLPSQPIASGGAPE